LIATYETTIRTNTNGIAAAAERDEKKSAAPDEAAPVKYPIHAIIRNRVVSEGRRSHLCLAPPVIFTESTVLMLADVGLL
jgi:hypothetical protein